MVNKETHPLVEEVEVDQEKIHTKDWIQEPKISSRPQKEKVDQLILYAVSKMCSSVSSASIFSNRRTVHC